jgi:hypothetical protein
LPTIEFLPHIYNGNGGQKSALTGGIFSAEFAGLSITTTAA